MSGLGADHGEVDATASVTAAAAALVAAFAEGRIEDYFDAFAPDATFVFHPERERVRSREDYRTMWDGWERDDGFRVLGCRSEDPQVTMLADEVGLFVHDVDTRVLAAGDEAHLRERETIVFALRDGRWLAVHEHLSPRPD